MKHIKLYEEHKEDLIVNKIYENWKYKEDPMWTKLNEDNYFDEDGKMTSGEERAFSRGLQIMTKPQMAAIYLFALGKSENVGADYVKMIDGMQDFGYFDETDKSFFNITVPALADAIGMDSDRTLSYTLSKFKNLIDGVGETSSQSLSDKLINAFNTMAALNPTEVAIHAAEAIQDSSNTTNRDKADSRNVEASGKRQEAKKISADLGLAIHSYAKDINANVGHDPAKSTRLAINKIAKEKNIDVAKLENMYRLYTKSMNIEGFTV